MRVRKSRLLIACTMGWGDINQFLMVVLRACHKFFSAFLPKSPTLEELMQRSDAKHTKFHNDVRAKLIHQSVERCRHPNRTRPLVFTPWRSSPMIYRRLWNATPVCGHASHHHAHLKELQADIHFQPRQSPP